MFLFLFVLWLGFNGAITLEIVLLGLFITGALCLFCVKAMDYQLKHELTFMRLLPDIAAYFLLLVKEIVLANWAVMRVILSPRAKITPTMTEFTPDITNKNLQVLLANSITLTPGTITYRMEHGELCVHCLTLDMANGMEDSGFVRRITRMEAKFFHD